MSEIVSILFGFYFNYVLYLYCSKEQANEGLPHIINIYIMNTVKNQTKSTVKNNTKQGKVFTPKAKKQTPKVKKPSALTVAQKELVNFWKEENLTPKGICKFFNEVGKDKAENFITELNKSFSTKDKTVNLKLVQLNYKLLKFGYTYELQKTELTAENNLNFGDLKTHFSPNFILNLMKRKAKYGTHTTPEFKAMNDKMCLNKCVRMIESEKRKEVINKALAESKANK